MGTRGEGGCVGEVTTAGAGPARGAKPLLPDVYLPFFISIYRYPRCYDLGPGEERPRTLRLCLFLAEFARP